MLPKKERRPPCRICGTQSYRPSGVGTLTCIRGHVLEGVVKVVSDFYETNVELHRRATRLRTKATVARKIQIYGGEAAKVALLKAFQFILQSQVEFLIRECKVPLELEDAVRRLWGMYLEFNPRLRVDWSEVEGPNANAQAAQGIPEYDLPPLYDSDSEAYASDHSADTVEEAVADAAKEPFVQLEQVTLRWTLVLLYLGCQSIQCPVLLVDLLHLATLNRLPYMNPYPLLPAEFHAVEGMPLKLAAKLPTLHQLYTSTCLMAKMFWLRFHVSIPLPAFSSIACRLLEHFRLPAQLYPVLKNMASDAGVDFGGSLALGGLGLAESLVAGLLVIAFKCLYGLDGKARPLHPAFPNLPPLEQLLAHMAQANQRIKHDLIPSHPSELLNCLYVRPNFITSTLGKAFKPSADLKGGPLDARTSFSGLVEEYTSSLKDLSLQELPVDNPALQLPVGGSVRAGDGYPLNDPAQRPHYGQAPECCLLVKHLAAYFLDGDHAMLMRAVCKLEARLLHRLGSPT